MMLVRIIGQIQFLLPVGRGSRLKQGLLLTRLPREVSEHLANKSTSPEPSRKIL